MYVFRAWCKEFSSPFSPVSSFHGWPRTVDFLVGHLDQAFGRLSLFALMKVCKSPFCRFLPLPGFLLGTVTG